MPRVFGSFSVTHLCFQVLGMGILLLIQSLSSMQHQWFFLSLQLEPIPLAQVSNKDFIFYLVLMGHGKTLRRWSLELFYEVLIRNCRTQVSKFVTLLYLGYKMSFLGSQSIPTLMFCNTSETVSSTDHGLKHLNI